MRLIDRLFRRKSATTSLDRLIARLDGTQSAAGVHVNEATAMRVAAVYSSVRVIAETIGSLPLNMHRRRADGGRERAAEHPLQILLHDRPNGWQTAQEFREMLTEHALLRGAGYAFINWRSRASNIVDELIPLHPDRVAVRQLPDNSLAYELRRADGTRVPLMQDEVFVQTRNINKAGVSVIMVEQNAKRCLQICDRGYVLDHGRTAYSGTGKALADDPKVIELYLGTLGQKKAG